MNTGSIQELDAWLREDGWGEVHSYWSALPQTPVKAVLKIKTPMVLAGLEWFEAVFKRVDPSVGAKLEFLKNYEGKYFSEKMEIIIPQPLSWATAISSERLALNLIHRASSVATATRELVEIARPHGIQILDTRKTTPGLRELEKYAVRVGGGANHRFTQTDCFMIKDNHKELLGLKGAVEFFKKLNQPYKTLITEIHGLSELETARSLGLRFFMLDNFSSQDLSQACASKRQGEFFEVSGGINKATIYKFLVKGVDALSVGKITQFPDAVDISFKFKPE
jgi:nicotinate-nucleotide pyrophosphorylase (carboxylating)